jgi:hypothetical protein
VMAPKPKAAPVKTIQGNLVTVNQQQQHPR